MNFFVKVEFIYLWKRGARERERRFNNVDFGVFAQRLSDVAHLYNQRGSGLPYPRFSLVYLKI